MHFEDPGAVFELVAGMEFGIIAPAGLPHFPEDLEPALTQASQRTGMGFAARTKLFVIDGCPRRAFPAEVGPEMHGGAQRLIAVAAQMHFMDLAGLEADGGGARKTLQSAGIKTRAV